MRSTIEDLLLMMDRRLDPYGAGAPDALAAMFDLTWRNVTYRPSRLAIDTVLHEAMSASDVAQLLINLEAIGFKVDPAPMVDALVNGIRKRPMIDNSELSVLWFERNRHRGPPMTIGTAKGRIPAKFESIGVTNTGYRVGIWRDIKDELAHLEVRSPRYRRRKPPIETDCPTCGWKWYRGDPESSAIHRREHKDRMVIIDPQPHPQVLRERGLRHEPAWVTSGSKAWKHREMYERARAFRREFGYDFVQWGSESGESDPDAHGYLFLDCSHTIVGACAFRLREDDSAKWWALQWVWISPNHRRQGHLERNWDKFKQKFGNFEVESPLSDAMTSFLAKRGDSRLSSESFQTSLLLKPETTQ